MYSSRGIGRHVYNDRKTHDRSERSERSERSPERSDRSKRSPERSKPSSERYSERHDRNDRSSDRSERFPERAPERSYQMPDKDNAIVVKTERIERTPTYSERSERTPNYQEKSESTPTYAERSDMTPTYTDRSERTPNYSEYERRDVYRSADADNLAPPMPATMAAIMPPTIAPTSNSNFKPNPTTYTPNPANFNFNPNPINAINPINPITSNPCYNSDYPLPPPEELTQKQKEEIIFQEKLQTLFQNVNSVDDLINLKELYNSKVASLDTLLQKSILREGEILRNKRRDREGFKDPAILENRALQADVKRKLDEVNRFVVEIDKKIRAYNKAVNAAKADGDKPSNYEAQLLQNSLITTTAVEEEIEDEEDEYELENQTKEYFDPGSHWCRDCDKLIPKINEFFEHLHTKEHWKLANNEIQPWKKPSKKVVDNKVNYFKPKTKTPTKGAQFLIPIRGFYCPLCSLYLADNTAAEDHLKTAKHNRIYNRFTCLNIDYEHKWNSDKGKALMRHQMNERKRLKDEEQKENEKKKEKEEIKNKEEKEVRKRKREEEMKRKEKEEREQGREREKDFKDFKVNKSVPNNEKSSERFRLKTVTLDLNDRKNNKSSLNSQNIKHKEKPKKRKRRLSSSSDSSSSSSNAPPKKPRTYFGDPYKDPKLKVKSYVPLIRLNKSTAHRYHCKPLLKLIDESKTKKVIKTEKDINSSDLISESNAFHNHTIKAEKDSGFNVVEEIDDKQLKGVIDGILKDMDEECGQQNDKVNGTAGQTEDKLDTQTNESENRKERIDQPVDKESEIVGENKENKMDDSIQEENNLVIDHKEKSEDKEKGEDNAEEPNVESNDIQSENNSMN